MNLTKWLLKGEIGIIRKPEVTKLQAIGSPVSIQRIREYGDFLILNKNDKRSEILRLFRKRLRKIHVKDLKCQHGYIKSLHTIDSRNILIIAGNSPREILYIDFSGQIARRVWDSYNMSNLNAPSYAVPYKGNILVADAACHHGKHSRPAGICLLSDYGESIWEWRPYDNGGWIGEPIHISILPDERIVVTDCEHHQVFCFRYPGEICWVHGHYGSPGRDAGYLSNPSSTSLTPNNTILIADTRNHRIVEVTMEGKLLQIVGGELNEDGSTCSSLCCPMNAIQMEDGGIYVADTGNSRIVLWSNSSVETILGAKEIPHRILSFPRSVQPVVDNRYLVADTNNDRVILINENNRIEWQYGNGIPKSNSHLKWPRCARLTTDSSVIIADGLNGRIVLVNRHGAIINEINQLYMGKNRLELKDPHDVFLTPQRTIYLADSAAKFVGEFDQFGQILWSFRECGVLKDPHQIVFSGQYSFVIVDPSVGIISVNRNENIYSVTKKIESSEGETVLISQPKALLNAGLSTIIAESYNPHYSLIVLDRGKKIYGINSLYSRHDNYEETDILHFHNPRWLTVVPRKGVIISDYLAHRLLHVIPVTNNK